MNEYITLAGAGEYFFEDRKSRFIGEAAPVETEDEALAFLESVRKKYPDANHHVYAYLMKDGGICRFSDDREPQGTAGLPVLDTLRKPGIVNAAVVVTRYFGGTLLGTGGLVHAYSETAAGALRAAGIVTCALRVRCRFSLSYSDYQKLEAYLRTTAFETENAEFGGDVMVTGRIVKTEFDTFVAGITDYFSGRTSVLPTDEFFSP